MSIKPTQPIVLGKPTAHISIICATGALTASQFSPAAAGSQVSGHRRSSFRSHPHLLPRPYPCPLSAPWHATSAPLVVAACGHGEERNREVSWRVWMTRRLLCACSVFALPLRGLFLPPACSFFPNVHAPEVPSCPPRAKACAPAPSRATFRRFRAAWTAPHA
jgi:hypothetical protein